MIMNPVEEEELFMLVMEQLLISKILYSMIINPHGVVLWCMRDELVTWGFDLKYLQ